MYASDEHTYVRDRLSKKHINFDTHEESEMLVTK